jgi:hypothetical protein
MYVILTFVIHYLIHYQYYRRRRYINYFNYSFFIKYSIINMYPIII